MKWDQHSFEQFDINTLYDIIKLRIDIFVVEQTCYYPELDNLDRDSQTIHVYAYQDKQLMAYLRCLAPGVAYPKESAIGRVVIAPEARGQNLGHELLRRGVAACEQAWPQHDIHLSAQAHLQGYYGKHGFNSVGEGYLEDGIPHIGMVRKRQ